MRDNRRFKDVVRTIESAEKDKDKFLRAARLSRHEKSRLSEETIFAMFCMLMMFGFMAALFIFG